MSPTLRQISENKKKQTKGEIATKLKCSTIFVGLWTCAQMFPAKETLLAEGCILCKRMSFGGI